MVYWILAAICLLIALTNRRLRPVGIIGIVILGLMLTWGMLQRMRGAGPQEVRGSPTSPTAAISTFPLEQLQTEQLHLAGNGAPFELRGHITNLSSDLQLRSFTVVITRRDCYEGALDPSGCVVLWQSKQWVELALAPGESREFANSFWTRGDVPRSRGTVQDQIELVAADGRAVTTPETAR